MSNQIKVICLSLALIFGFCDFAQAQPRVQRIWGDLSPVRFTGVCGSTGKIETDNSVTSVMGLWFLKDKKDTIISPRGLEVKGIGPIGGPLPEEFVNLSTIIPNTLKFYISKYNLSGWDRKAKTVNVVKQSWIFQGWGTGSNILCYGSWAGRVKYR